MIEFCYQSDTAEPTMTVGIFRALTGAVTETTVTMNDDGTFGHVWLSPGAEQE